MAAILPSGSFTLAAIAYGSAIGLLSMGLTLTYLTTKVPNFAHATIAMIGATVTLYLVDRIYYYSRSYSVFIVAPVVGGLLAALFAVFMYVAILKPLADRGNTVIGLMIATFAVDIILMNVLTLILNLTRGVNIPKLIGATIYDFEPFIKIGSAYVPAYAIVLPIEAVIITMIFHFFLTKTKFGVAMRATIENPSLAEVMGVNVNLVTLVSWLISGFLAGFAGAFIAYALSKVDPVISALIIVSVFAGSIVGGLSSVYWGLIGGFLVGFAEKWGTILVNNIYRVLIAQPLGLPSVSLVNYEKVMSLGLVIIVLLYAPQGLSGVDWGRLAARLGLRRGGGR